ncbi:MAG: PTS sugar transporter subunit IIA [Spirochaetia bacterium]|nr:PTS sugar transporter subunit IIA [Spirochaetia bacterium]
MKLNEILSVPLISVDLKATDKEGVLEELLDLLCSSGKVHDRTLALRLLQEREEKMSTGLQDGIAIPHAKTDAVQELIACIGIKKEGLDFLSADGKPAKIFVMALSPSDCVSQHLKFLADIGAVLSVPLNRKKLLRASSPEQVLSVFLGLPN